MISAILLLNCRFPFDAEIIAKLDKLSSVTYAYKTSGIYDVIVKITADTEASLHRTIRTDIDTITNVDSTVTMIIAKRCKQTDSIVCNVLVQQVFNIGKRRVLSESQLKEMVMPGEGQLFGRVVKLVGGDNIIVKCTDGKVRTCRIRGKIKRRMWIRDNDLVLIAPWDFQSERADIIWRYISAHAEKIKQDGHLTGLD